MITTHLCIFVLLFKMTTEILQVYRKLLNWGQLKSLHNTWSILHLVTPSFMTLSIIEAINEKRSHVFSIDFNVFYR